MLAGSTSSRLAILLIFVLLFVSMRVFSYTRKSATWDEPIHLASGYAALRYGDYRIDPAHPPLGRMWAALPLVAMDGVTLRTDVIDRTSPRQWLLGADAYTAARRFLHTDNDADRLLYASRFMIVLLGAAAGVLLFFWALEWLGLRAAVCALAFYLISPNLTANASLVTTDVPETLFLFGTVYFLWRYCRRPTSANLVAVAGCCGAAVVTKFSGVILGPIVAVLLIIAVWQGRLSARRAAGIAALLCVTTVTAIWAVYGFRYAPGPDPSWTFHLSDGQSDFFLTPIVAWIDAHRLLPNAFAQGLLYCGISSVQSAYLLGQYSSSGWWYYFPVAMAVKTPVPSIALFACGVVVCVRRWRQLGLVNDAFIFWPAAAYLAFAIASGVNIGVRHVLPVYPFILLAAAAAAHWLLGLRGYLPRVAFAGLMAFWVWSYASVYPNSLTFFNRLAGGPARGPAYLSDSNLDWGQHLKSLKRWMDRIGVRHINLAYFGQADPEYYGIHATLLPGATGNVAKPQLPGYVAVSATILNGVYLPPAGRLMYRPFRDLEPVATIGHTINVYWIDEWPEVRGGVDDPRVERELAEDLLRLNWRRHAVLHYERYLERRPDDAAARTNLGLVLLSLDRTADALSALRTAVARAPGDALAQRTLGAVLLQTGEVSAARPHIVAALERLPRDAIARDVYGRLLAAEGRLTEAAAAFEHALALDPNLAVAREHLARVRAMLKS